MSKKMIRKLSDEKRLPCEDGEPMETEYHYIQLKLLRDSLKEYFKGQRVYVGANMFVYYSEDQVKTDDFKGPDLFLVLDASKRVRDSWVVWEEGKGPNMVVELLSESTKKNDIVEKKRVYQEKLKVPEYFYFSPLSFVWAGFRLKDGVYENIEADNEGRLRCEELGLFFIRWEGEYESIERTWMRVCDPFGDMVPTPDEKALRADKRAEEKQELLVIEKGISSQAIERAEQADQRVQEEKFRADEEKLRAEKLAEKLKDLGVDPDGLL